MMKPKIIKYVKNRNRKIVIPIDNNKKKKGKKMVTEKEIKQAEEIVKDSSNVKRIKSEKGLIEKTESSKIILTEDNRQVLND